MGKARNPKSETRNSKLETKFEYPMIETKEVALGPSFWTFEFWSFHIVSDFVLGISSLLDCRHEEKANGC